MKKQLSFSRLLHKDKLMMLVCLILAFVIWAVVDFNQGYYHSMDFTVPVKVEVSEYATGLRVVEGSDITATVTVKAPRSELKKMRAEDITITADTGGIYSDVTKREVNLFVSTTAKCEIVSVKGPKIKGDKLTNLRIQISCRQFVEKAFPLNPAQVEMPNLTLSNTEMMQFATENMVFVAATAGDESIKDNSVIISGPTASVKSIDKVWAVIADTMEVSKTERFTATLVAYDKTGKQVQDITFENPASGEVGVIVPVIVYQNESFSLAEAKNVPVGLQDKLILTPSSLKVGVIPEKEVLDTYVETIRSLLTVDFDQWMPENEERPIIKTVPLEEKEGIYFADSSVKNIAVALDVNGYDHKTVSIPLSEKNVTILCDEGYNALLTQQSLDNVVLCGPADVLRRLKSGNIKLEIDASGQGEGSHTFSGRLKFDLPDDSENFVWIYYGDNEYTIEYAIGKSKMIAE